MLDIQLLRGNIEDVASKLKNKKFNLDINYFTQLEDARKVLQIELESLQAKRNSSSKEIGVLKSKGLDTTAVMSEVANLGEELKSKELKLSQLQLELNKYLSGIPNISDDSVPFGLDETSNVEVRRFMDPIKFDFAVQDHVDLGMALGRGIDFETGAKISGSRFAVLRGQIAKLHRVLAQFMLDTHIEEHGYTETYVPYIVNANSLYGTGQLPKFEEDLFKTNRGEEAMYLIPTAEVPVTNMYADTLLKNSELPIKLVAHSPCFRSEAGSYGRDTKGLIRVHQFDKVELVHIVKEEDSFIALEELLSNAEKILQLLKLPYRIVLLCTGDSTFSSAKTYDIEVWVPSQNTYREISSCSNMTDFQARRMHGRYKDEAGKNKLFHTLNGSGLAVGRTLVAVLENYQNEDGSITVPEVLRSMMGCDVIR